MVANPSYRGVEYAYVIGYWVALLGSCHLVATAPSAPPPLAILGGYVEFTCIVGGPVGWRVGWVGGWVGGWVSGQIAGDGWAA